jgi:hypothetical protein
LGAARAHEGDMAGEEGGSTRAIQATHALAGISAR